MKKYKKTILIDLDGVLNQYTGNFNEDYIPDIKEGAREFITSLTEEFDIKLFTTRDKKQAIKWLKNSNLYEKFNGVTNTKDLAWLFIDDRCIKFTGDYKALYKEIKTFKPWYKKD